MLPLPSFRYSLQVFIAIEILQLQSVYFLTEVVELFEFVAQDRKSAIKGLILFNWFPPHLKLQVTVLSQLVPSQDPDEVLKEICIFRIQILSQLN